MLLQLSQCFPLCPSLPGFPLPSSDPPPSLSSCPWVMHVSSLASPTLFLTSPILCLQIMLLNPYTFSPILLAFPPANNPTNDLHIYDSILLLVVCLVCFCCCCCFLDSVVVVYKFAVILLSVVLIFFFLNKTL